MADIFGEIKDHAQEIIKLVTKKRRKCENKLVSESEQRFEEKKCTTSPKQVSAL
jgi:hypothetical protein